MTKKTQKEMCEDAILGPARRFHAFMGIMNGPNPLTDAELVTLAEKYPERYGFFKAYVGKFTNPDDNRDLYDLTLREDEIMGEYHDATHCSIEGWGCYVASMKTPDGKLETHEESFPRGDPPKRQEALTKCAEWLIGLARRYGKRLVTTEVKNGKYKLVLWPRLNK